MLPMSFQSVSFTVVMVVVAAGWAWTARRRLRHGSPKPTLRNSQMLRVKCEAKSTGTELQIEPLPRFNWQDTEPLKFRPFRPIYYITMALQADIPSDLIIIDNNYLDRVTERRQTLKDHSSTVSGVVPEGITAVDELYTYLISNYLPIRYPTMFSLSEDRKIFKNLATNVVSPVHPPNEPITALHILGETVEDDMFLLHGTSEGHRMVAFVCCFPSGFDPSSKLGKVLKDIHKPVPAYEKIGPSMEKFFGKLEVGKSVKRINWSVTTQQGLFSPTENHVHAGEKVEENQDVDIEKARVRMEYQTFTRLPQTRAILFSFKSYLYPVREIKEEGLGLQFADAIEGLKQGNAPGMWVYKGGIRWGTSVCEYLRS